MTEVQSEGVGTATSGAYPPPPAVYSLRLVEIRSYLIVSQRLLRTKSGSLDDLAAFARGILVRNLLLGWWGFPFGLVWTPMALASNAKALRKLRALGASGNAAPGWFDDPSGRHAGRYWDGSAWTDQVTDVGPDALPGT